MPRERPPIKPRGDRTNTNLLLKKKLLAKALRTTRGGVRNAPPRRATTAVVNPVPGAVRKTKTATEAASGVQKGWRKLYVGDLAETTSGNDLQRDFGKFGKIVDIWVARNPPGFAFIDFLESTDAARALRVMDGSTRLGPKIKVEFAKKIGPKTSSAIAFARKRMFASRPGNSVRGTDSLSRHRRLSGSYRASSPRSFRVSGRPPSRDRDRGAGRERGFRGRGRSLSTRDRGFAARESFNIRDRLSFPPRRMSPPLMWGGRSPDRGRSPPPRAPLPRYPPRRSMSPPLRRGNYSPPPMPPMPPPFNPMDPRFREMAVGGGWNRGRSPVMAPPPPPPRYRSRSPSPRFRGRSPPSRRSPGRFGRDKNRGRGRDGFDGSLGRNHGAASLVYPPLSLPPPSFMRMGDSPPRRLRSPPPSPPQNRGGRMPLRDRSPLRRSPPRMPMPPRSPPPLPPMRPGSPGIRGRDRSPPLKRSPIGRPLGPPPPRFNDVLDRRNFRNDMSPPRMKNEPGMRRYGSPPLPPQRNRGPGMDPSPVRVHRNSWGSPERKFSPPPMRNRSSPPPVNRSQSPMRRNMRSPPRPRSPPEPDSRGWSPPPGPRGLRTPPKGFGPPRNLKSHSPSDGRYRGMMAAKAGSPPPMPGKRPWSGSPNQGPMNNRNLQQQARPRTPPRGYTPPRSRSPPRFNNKMHQPMTKNRSSPPPRSRSPPPRGREKAHQSYNGRNNRR